MTSAETFKRMFRGASFELDDLYLLETFQISYLPGWVPELEFAMVLQAYPSIKRYLVKKCPPITGYVEHLAAQYPSPRDQRQLDDCIDVLVWTIADLLVYNKCPEVYDSLEFHQWDFNEVTEITALDDQVVIDGGAGTGRVALEAAKVAHQVYAIEPVSRLRQFIREKASLLGLTNVFVLDGFLDAIPLPSRIGDVLITSHALGWRLEDELMEFERVIKKKGVVIHCPGTSKDEEDQHKLLVSSRWNYDYAFFEVPDGRKRKYWKRLG